MKYLLYEDSVGPFDVTLFGTFQLSPASNPSAPGTVIVRWYAGPGFPGAVEDLITGSLFDVIKVLPGRVVEFQVYQNRRGLEITVRSLFPEGAQSETSVETFAKQKVAIDKIMQELQGQQNVSSGTEDAPAAAGGGRTKPPPPSRCISPECGEVRPCDPPNNSINCSDPLNPFCIQAEPSITGKSSGCC